MSIGGSFWVKDPMKMFALIWGYYSFKAEMDFSKCSIPARFLDLSILHEKTRKPRHFLQKNENGGCFTVHCQLLCNHAFLNSANYTVLHERWSWCSWQIPRRLQGYSQFDQDLGIVWSKFEPNLFTTWKAVQAVSLTIALNTQVRFAFGNDFLFKLDLLELLHDSIHF